MLSIRSYYELFENRKRVMKRLHGRGRDHFMRIKLYAIVRQSKWLASDGMPNCRQSMSRYSQIMSDLKYRPEQQLKNLFYKGMSELHGQHDIEICLVEISVTMTKHNHEPKQVRFISAVVQITDCNMWFMSNNTLQKCFPKCCTRTPRGPAEGEISATLYVRRGYARTGPVEFPCKA
ncbi:hypothetical protein TNCV_3888351 [Trichonephila clavipes]|nr:hypothetical protein TNCV_3888351 [Trichonephila clavipes]